MKKRFAAIAVLALLLCGCGGGRTRLLDGKFVGTQRWEERTHDIFFDYSTIYFNCEFGTTAIYGCMTTDEQKIDFMICCDSEGNLDFYALPDDGKEAILRCDAISADESSYIVKVYYSEFPGVIPKGTKLVFDITEIEEDDVYVPALLGEKM